MSFREPYTSINLILGSLKNKTKSNPVNIPPRVIFFFFHFHYWPQQAMRGCIRVWLNLMPDTLIHTHTCTCVFDKCSRMHNTQRNLSMKLKQTHRHRAQTCDCQGSGGGMDWESRISRCKLLYIGQINIKVLLYSTGNYLWYPMVNHNGKE